MYVLPGVTHLLKLNDKVRKERLNVGFFFSVRFTRFHSDYKEPKSSILIVKH